MTRLTLRLGPLVALGLSGVLLAQGQSPTEWIRATAVRLTTTEAGHGFADLQPLKKVVGDARVVALGEATHGTREFFQLKHRMLEFLASEMGFTIFSIEANMPEAYRLNEYVLNGTGDPAALLKGMYFWTWDTEEMLEMIRWMRRFNESGKGRVQFTGFDMQVPDVAEKDLGTFVTKYDADYSATLTEATALVARATALSASNNFGLVSGSLPADAFAGKKVRFSGYIRTEGIGRSYAGLWFRANGPSGVLAHDNMLNRGATGTSDWKQYVIELSIPPTATSIAFGAVMPGDGQAWFDDLSIEVDGQRYTDPKVFDFEFESGLKGLSPSGATYRIEIDPAVAHGGKQSLRMTYLPSMLPPVDGRVVVTRFKDIMSHLEQGRARYQGRGATDREIDWAIQDARIVLQGLQVNTGEATRDRSMADNVNWILDRNPGARVVLWAHNMHVATGGRTPPPMGAELRKSLGPRMVVFGFAFNQGGFQAVSQKGTFLQLFAVPPLPLDTLDATLASAEIPIFAIDLRQAPAWFNEARRAREIGAVYPEGSPDYGTMKIVAPAIFDAMMFVEKTTPARANK